MIVHDCLQGSDLWHWHRLGLPTASNFGRIIQPVKGELSKGIDDYIAELIAETVTGPTEGGYMSRPMWEGTNIEADARGWYQYDRGVTIKQVGFVTDDLRRWGCSPDGLSDDDKGPGLELKGPTAKVHVGYMLDPESLDAAYKCQVHGGMVVCERTHWDLVSYCHGFEPVVRRVVWDGFTDKLAAALLAFTDRYAAAVDRVAELNGRPLVKPPPPRTKQVDDPIFMA